jgi:cell division protein ZipA
VLLLVGVLVIAGVFAYSRGWFAFNRFAGMRLMPRRRVAPVDESAEDPAETADIEPAVVVAPKPSPPRLADNSMVVTVRIMPRPGTQFPAEQLILALRAAQLQHGQYGIFHRLDEENAARIRYSVASLVEPGSFDLSKLKESTYRGISVFMVLPAPEDGVGLFDDMLQTARAVAKEIDGLLLDEQGGALSVQRERYMREEVIDFLRRHRPSVSHTGD